MVVCLGGLVLPHVQMTNLATFRRQGGPTVGAGRFHMFQVRDFVLGGPLLEARLRGGGAGGRKIGCVVAAVVLADIVTHLVERGSTASRAVTHGTGSERLLLQADTALPSRTFSR